MLSGKTILITGSTSGIGRQIALDVALKNGTPIITGRDKSKIKKVLDDIYLGSKAQPLSFLVDLKDYEHVESMVKGLPNLSGVVINAGKIDYSPIKYLKTEQINEMFQVNLFSNIYLIKRLLQEKRLTKNSSILFISSVSTKKGIPGTALYSSSKAALSAFAKVLASEVSIKNIKVNIISPGIIETKSVETGLEINKSAILKSYPLGFGETRDVSKLATFLLSDEAKWMTGSDITLDGGYSLI